MKKILTKQLATLTLYLPSTDLNQMEFIGELFIHNDEFDIELILKQLFFQIYHKGKNS